ncbi:hypothetical protein BH11VER1_BH11VER1_12980 [soil metagenome]
MKALSCILFLLCVFPGFIPGEDIKIDFDRARQLFQREHSGGALTGEETTYLDEAKRQRNAQSRPEAGRPELPGNTPPSAAAKGLVPLTELSGDYHGRDGGLYGGGKNEVPVAQQALATKARVEIKPLDADGKPRASGKIVMISLGMSNTTNEFSRFVPLANADPRKAGNVTIVDCAQGAQTAHVWADASARAWSVAEDRLKQAGVAASQVQVVWIKQANAGPRDGTDTEIKRLQDDMEKIVLNVKQKYPNIHLAFLSSRIYAGYAQTSLNPEPYAYEGAFAMRGLIQKQMSGDATLGVEKAPVLLWGPYLWAAGTTPRKADGLTWSPEDFSGDGTHPGPAGREKVAKLLLDFFTGDSNANPWFVKHD